MTVHDRPLPEDDAIHAAHPTRTGKHETYAEAMRLVGARRSKGALVDLVNWLLVQLDTAQADVEAMREAAVAVLPLLPRTHATLCPQMWRPALGPCNCGVDEAEQLRRALDARATPPAAPERHDLACDSCGDDDGSVGKTRVAEQWLCPTCARTNATPRCACGAVEFPPGTSLISSPTGDHWAESCRRIDKPEHGWIRATPNAKEKA